MGALSWWHWLIIIAAFILIFGAKRLPDAARGVGRSLRILKSEVAAMQEESGKNAPAQPEQTSAPSQLAAPAPIQQPQTAPQTAPLINGQPEQQG